MTLAEDIEKAAEGHPITHVIIGEIGWGGGYGVEDRHTASLARKGELLTWDEGRPLLDYEYDSGYGAPDCSAFYAWTVDTVIFMTQYDGSTTVDYVPRNPSSKHFPAIFGQ